MYGFSVGKLISMLIPNSLGFAGSVDVSVVSKEVPDILHGTVGVDFQIRTNPLKSTTESVPLPVSNFAP